MLDFRIHTFLCVCRHMNYTRAAAELHITQPAVSQHIHYLEREYQTKLFIYRGKHLQLTPAGYIFWDAVKAIDHDDALLHQRLHDLEQHNETLDFGAIDVVAEFVLMDRLAAFLKSKLALNLNLHIGSASTLLAELDDSVLDFVIVESSFDQARYESLPFSSEPVIAVCGPDYDAPATLTLADLRTHCLILREHRAGIRQVVENRLAERGLTLADFPRRYEAGSLQAIKGLALRNCGITFIYAKSVRSELETGKLRQLEISDFSLTHAFSFLWRKGSMYRALITRMYDCLKG